MFITYTKKITEETNLFDFELLLNKIYEERKSNTIYFDIDNWEDEAYISIDFDEYSKDWEASVYINLYNTYLRSDLTISQIIEICKKENIF